MLYVSYDAFLEYVLPQVHGCPKAVARTAIRDAVIEFCEKSHLWVEPSELTNIYAGWARYAFDAREDDGIVTTLNYAAVEDKPLQIVSEEGLDSKMHWRKLESNTPTMIFMDTSSTVRLVGVPTEDKEDALYLEVVLKPSRNSTECPQFIFEDWATYISHGALAILKAMAGRVWADPNLVSYHRNEFRAGISRAKSAAQKSYQVLSRSMRAQNFLEL